MTEVEVEVPFGESPSEVATLLLAAAEELDGRDQWEVRTTSGAFLVPRDIADQAGVEYPHDETEGESRQASPKRGRRRTTPDPGQEE